MKKLTRIMTTAMVAATMVMSTACSGANTGIQEADTTTSAATVEASTEAVVEATVEATTEATEEATEESSEAATEASSEDAADAESSEEAKAYERGTIDGTTYTNESFGVTVDLPSNWVFLSDDDIATLTGVSKDMFDNETLSKALDEVSSLIDMYAVDGNSGADNVNLTVEKKSILTKGLDAQGYVDAAKATTKITLEASGFENVEIESSTVETANGEIPCLKAHSVFGGQEIYQVIGVYSIGDYFVSVTSTVYGSDTAADVFQYVSYEE